MKHLAIAAIIATTLVYGATTPARAQEAVVGASDPDALFTSPNPVLNRNKQAAYKIFKVLPEANHWDEADQYLTARYLQHNPNAVSGRQGVIDCPSSNDLRLFGLWKNGVSGSVCGLI